MNSPMNWGVIGCGTIGDRRSAQLPEGVKVVSCFDVSKERASALAAKLDAKPAASLDELLSTPGLKAVIIAAINSELVPIAQACIDRGIHVLVEKPAARSVRELKALKIPKGVVVKIGFNHRFHPAFEHLRKEIANRSKEDPVMFIRAQYGNGARVGFEREWRANIELGGGGELLDQGVHVLDLASVLVPDLEVVSGYTRTHFWKMAVDDNAWGILRSKNTGATFTFHVSSSEWKNEFRFEVYTRQRKYQWLGLGRSYGPERLIVYKMKAEMGPPDLEEVAFPGDDFSWRIENENFLAAINGKAAIDGGYDDAVRSLALVEDIYVSSREAQGAEGHPRWWKDNEA